MWAINHTRDMTSHSQITILIYQFHKLITKYNYKWLKECEFYECNINIMSACVCARFSTC